MRSGWRVRTRIVAVAGCLTATAVAVTPGAFAASSDSNDAVEEAPTWTQVTDSDGRNIDEVSVARTADDVLHVLWHVRAGPNLEEIRDTPVADGKVGTTATAAAGWASAGNPAVIVTADGGLRVFFARLDRERRRG